VSLNAALGDKLTRLYPRSRPEAAALRDNDETATSRANAAIETGATGLTYYFAAS
jgi:hypothetical protein